MPCEFLILSLSVTALRMPAYDSLFGTNLVPGMYVLKDTVFEIVIIMQYKIKLNKKVAQCIFNISVQ